MRVGIKEQVCRKKPLAAHLFEGRGYECRGDRCGDREASARRSSSRWGDALTSLTLLPYVLPMRSSSRSEPLCNALSGRFFAMRE
jgi:hypothetical protein